MTSDVLIWHDNNVNTEDLTLRRDNPTAFFKNLDGFDSLPIDPVYQRAPFQHGKTITRMRAEARELSFEIVLVASRQGEFASIDPWAEIQTRKRRLINQFSPLSNTGEKNVGTLTIQQLNGETYLIDAVPLSCEFPGGRARSPSHQECLVTLEAEDPFFRSQSITSVSLAPGQESTTFPVEFPISSPSGSLIEVNPESDVPTPVAVIVDGPANGPILVNSVTGDRMSFPDLTVPAGYALEVDTAFGRKTAEIVNRLDPTDVTNVYHELVGTLFELNPGSNFLFYEDDDGTASSAVIKVEFRSRFVGIG